MFFIAYVLAIIAVKVDNFNLGIFALVLIFLTIFGYYLKPENEYFIWVYNCTPTKFLIEKNKNRTIVFLLFEPSSTSFIEHSLF